MEDRNPYTESQLHLAYCCETRKRITSALICVVGVTAVVILAYMAGRSESQYRQQFDGGKLVDVQEVMAENYRQGWNDACDAFQNETPENLRQMADEIERRLHRLPEGAEPLPTDLQDMRDLEEAEGAMDSIYRGENGDYISGNPFENYR